MIMFHMIISLLITTITLTQISGRGPPRPPTTPPSSKWLQSDLPLRLPRSLVDPPYAPLPRRFNITREEFSRDYARAGHPVIVAASIDAWDWEVIEGWTATGLERAWKGEVHEKYPDEGDEKRDGNGDLVGFYSEEEVKEIIPELKKKAEMRLVNKEVRHSVLAIFLGWAVHSLTP